MIRAALVLLLLAALVAALSLGSISFTPRQILESLHPRSSTGSSPAAFESRILWELRAPRIALAAVVGAALALSGAALQGLFRNPLADPGLVGVSGGAAFAAALALVAGRFLAGPFAERLGGMLVPFCAFAGGTLATVLAWTLARPRGQQDGTRLILAGVAINAVAFAGVSFLTFLADDAQLRSLAFWNLGGLGGATWGTAGVTALLVSIALIALLRSATQLDAFQLGEDGAFYSGVSVRRLRRIVVASVALAVGGSIAAAGAIGFVGLVIPHAVRSLGFRRHRSLLFASALLGASLLVVADLVARVAVAPREIPVGIVTALCGAPFFILLLQRRVPRAEFG